MTDLKAEKQKAQAATAFLFIHLLFMLFSITVAVATVGKPLRTKEEPQRRSVRDFYKLDEEKRF